MLESTSAKRQSDGTYKLIGVVASPVGRWPFDDDITHEESAERYRASWDNSRGSLKLNRGSWTLTPAGPEKTLVVYALEVEVRRVPAFLIRNALLSREIVVIESIERWLKTKHGT
jgi:hypothetical protein